MRTASKVLPIELPSRQAGDTIAVVANGVDRPYPMGNRELLERVADLGLMVSEVPPGAVPTRHRFIARARLMAALSTATVVVEAGVMALIEIPQSCSAGSSGRRYTALV